MAAAPTFETSFAYHLPTPVSEKGTVRAWWAVRMLPAVVALALFVLPQQASNSAGFAVPLPESLGSGHAGYTNHEVVPSLESDDFTLAVAAPFYASYGDAGSPSRAEDCLTQAIYYEGALEPELGQRAIAQVVLNRVRHPQYPNSVCGVVFEGQHLPTGCQFTFTCDGSRMRAPVAGIWRKANLIAKAALGGMVTKEVGFATHYHADYVQPYWAPTLDPSGQIGRHIFYRWRGTAGTPGAFSAAYTGREPLIAEWAPRTADKTAGSVRTVGLEGGADGGLAVTPDAASQPIIPAASFRARPLLLAGADSQAE
jgi:hypothetical protein